MTRRRAKKDDFPLNYSLGRAVLDILLDVGERFTLLGTPYKRIKLMYRDLGAPEPVPWRYNRAIRYLEYTAQIEVVEKKNRIFLKLTEKGKLRALLDQLAGQYQTQAKWDGKWRLIIWDIPEKSRGDRNYIRRFFKNLGFYRLQQSVFITPYELPVAAVEYLRESGLLSYIRFLRVDKLDDDKFLKQHFGLK